MSGTKPSDQVKVGVTMDLDKPIKDTDSLRRAWAKVVKEMQSAADAAVESGFSGQLRSRVKLVDPKFAGLKGYKGMGSAMVTANISSPEEILQRQERAAETAATKNHRLRMSRIDLQNEIARREGIISRGAALGFDTAGATNALNAIRAGHGAGTLAGVREAKEIIRGDRETTELRARIITEEKRVINERKRHEREALGRAADRYAFARSIHTGIHQGVGAIAGIIAGGAEAVPAGMLGLVGAAGNVLHMQGMRRYALHGIGGKWGSGGGGGAGGGGAPAGAAPAGGGSAPNVGAGIAQGAAAGSAMGGLGMAVAGSVIGAVASGLIALISKGGDIKRSGANYAVAYDDLYGGSYYKNNFDPSYIKGVQHKYVTRNKLPFNAGYWGETEHTRNAYEYSEEAARAGLSARTQMMMAASRFGRENYFTMMSRPENGGLDRAASLQMLNQYMSGTGGVDISRAMGSGDPWTHSFRFARGISTAYKYGIDPSLMGRALVEPVGSTMVGATNNNNMILAAQKYGLNANGLISDYMGLRAQGAAAGLATNPDMQAMFALQLQGSGVSKEQAMNVPRGIMGAREAAASTITGATANLGQHALLAYALSKTGSFADAAEYIRSGNMTDQEALSAIRKYGGDDATRNWLTGQGISKKAAESLMAGKFTPGAEFGIAPAELETFRGALRSPGAQRDAKQQEYESTPDREARLARIDATFDSIATTLSDIADSLTKIVF